MDVLTEKQYVPFYDYIVRQNEEYRKTIKMKKRIDSKGRELFCGEYEREEKKMKENIQVSENMFVLPIDMDNKSVEEIARVAALRINEACEEIAKQRGICLDNGKDID